MNILSNAIIKNSSNIEYCKGYVSEKEELERQFTIPKLSSELNNWYENLPKFDYLIFPWTVEELYIVGTEYLLTKLGGYRFVSIKSKWEDLSIKGEWKESWIIIATWSDNPLIADISKEGTPIYYIMEGLPPKLLVDSLEKLDFFLGTWLNLHENKFCDMGAYIPSFYNSLDNAWRKNLSASEMVEIYEYMPILMSEEDLEDSENNEDYDNNEDEIGIIKGRIILQDLGSNKQKVFLTIKNEIGIGFGETKDILKKIQLFFVKDILEI